MPNAVDWYLVEVERRLRGRLPADQVTSILAETEDHLRELELGDDVSLTKAFGNPAAYSRAMFAIHDRKQESVWKQGRAAILWVSVCTGLLMVVEFFEDLVLADHTFAAYLSLGMCGVLLWTGCRSKRFILAPVLLACLAGTVVSSVVLGSLHTSPKDNGVKFVGVAPRFVSESPQSWAVTRREALVTDLAYVEEKAELAAQWSLTADDLRDGRTYRMPLYGWSYSNLRPVRFLQTDSLKEAVSAWINFGPYDSSDLKREIARMNEYSEVATWTSVPEQASREFWGLKEINILAGLVVMVGNLIRMLALRISPVIKRIYA